MTGGQIFYTHVMKTGGWSLSSLIRSQIPSELSFPFEHSDVSPHAAKGFVDYLMELDVEERARLRFISVHHPAWVAFQLAPRAWRLTILREPVSRTVSHLRQIAQSPGTPDDLEEIYADPGWRDRLSNYQTQLFADPGTREPSAPPAMNGPVPEGEDRNRILRALVQHWGTAIAQPMHVDAASFERAVATLERYDCVGVTEDLSRAIARVSERIGQDLPAAQHLNRTSSAAPVGRALLEQITDDNEFDLLLHAAARELASS